MEILIAAQRVIQNSITADLSQFAATRNWAAFIAILPLGIVFGAVHALTPGHGKTVLASYLLGSRLSALRSLAVSSALAITHIGSAVILSLVASTLISRTLGNAGRAPAMELVSRALLGVIGVWLLWRAWRARPHTHHEGLFVGFFAGLVPCPLTLFAMVLAISRGVPEAGVLFALAMMIGVGLTLGAVAAATTIGRNHLVAAIQNHAVSVSRVSRTLDAISGALLVCVAIYALL